MRLMLAEDERELSHALSAVLTHEKYEVDAVYDGDTALAKALSETYDGMILDIMMPGRDGLAVLSEIRSRDIRTPVLLLTAKTQVEDRIAGLDLGADDYLTKPFAMGELLARIRAMVRRKTEFAPNILQAGNVCLNRETLELYSDKAGFCLANKEFQMMELLMNSPGRPVSAEQMIERVWGGSQDAGEDVVWVYLSYLMKKLEAIGGNVRINPVEEKGYCLEEIS